MKGLRLLGLAAASLMSGVIITRGLMRSPDPTPRLNDAMWWLINLFHRDGELTVDAAYDAGLILILSVSTAISAAFIYSLYRAGKKLFQHRHQA